MDDNQNPYEPPKADVTPPPSVSQPQVLLPQPRALPAKAGINWLSASWSLVKNNLGTWVLLTVSLFAIQMLVSMVIAQSGMQDQSLQPILLLLVTLLSTFISGGILLGIRNADSGQPLQLDCLFEGFRQKLAPLAGLGALSFGASQVSEYILTSMVGLNLHALETGTIATEGFFTAVAPEQMILGVILYLLVLLLFWFATPLVALNDVPVFRAITLSFNACLRNPLPLILYSIAMGAILIAGMIPLLLGLLIVVPWMFSSMYVAYKQIFLQ